MDLSATLDAIARRAPQRQPRVAVLLGSGWGSLSALLDDALAIPYAELPGFPHAAVPGHEGQLWFGRLGAQPVALLSGRQHGYETGAVDRMALPLQAMQALGCHTLVQTNAAGSLRPDMPPQSLMLVRDHLNLPQRSPLVGLTGAGRFVDMVDAYDPGLCRLAQRVAARQQLRLFEGVYAWAFGPQFETPAEIRMLRRLGADAVGMSTVPETILARHLGLRVLALSLITNWAAGMSGTALSHAHTLQQASQGSEVACQLLAELVANLTEPETPT